MDSTIGMTTPAHLPRRAPRSASLRLSARPSHLAAPSRTPSVAQGQPNTWRIIQIAGDGNCLFRAISHQLYVTQERHVELRQAVVDHIILHSERYRQHVEVDGVLLLDYARQMAQQGCWGGELEIRAIEEIIDRKIHVHEYIDNGTLQQRRVSFDEDLLLPGVQPLRLSYHGGSHYNSLVDDTVTLPLPTRSTRVLFENRVMLYYLDAHRRLFEPILGDFVHNL
jgi:hypothetical protein